MPKSVAKGFSQTHCKVIPNINNIPKEKSFFPCHSEKLFSILLYDLLFFIFMNPNPNKEKQNKNKKSPVLYFNHILK